MDKIRDLIFTSEKKETFLLLMVVKLLHTIKDQEEGADIFHEYLDKQLHPSVSFTC